tara:strand:+ start:1118 stop:1279 length:162 start_codon:yes stop_codon:yes gene_type:complete
LLPAAGEISPAFFVKKIMGKNALVVSLWPNLHCGFAENLRRHRQNHIYFFATR